MFGDSVLEVQHLSNPAGGKVSAADLGLAGHRWLVFACGPDHVDLRRHHRARARPGLGGLLLVVGLWSWASMASSR